MREAGKGMISGFGEQSSLDNLGDIIESLVFLALMLNQTFIPSPPILYMELLLLSYGDRLLMIYGNTVVPVLMN